MTVLFVVLPLALLASAVALVGFVWSVRRGQLDDLVTPAMRMLVDDEARSVSSSVVVEKREPRDSSAATDTTSE